MSIRVGPWPTSTKRSWDIMPPFKGLANAGRWLSWKQVLGNAGALRLPVTPDTHGAVMDVVAADSHVDGCVHLDAGNLGSALLHHVIDVMDVVVLNDAEYTAHTADDTALLDSDEYCCVRMM